MAPTPKQEQKVPMDTDPAETIAALISGRGEQRYGLSAINQRAHALQAALLAEGAGAVQR